MAAAACRLEAAIDLPLDGIAVSADVRTFHRYSMGVSTLAGIEDAGAWPEDAPGLSYYQMTEAALDELAGRGRVDAVYFTAGVPDCQVSQFLSQLVARRLTPLPHVLGLTDQGPVAPFTALRLARRRIETGEAERAAVLVLEHRMFPSAVDLGRDAADRAVLLVLGTGPGRPVESVQITAGLEPRQGSALVAPAAVWAALAEAPESEPVRLTGHDPGTGLAGEAVFGADI